MSTQQKPWSLYVDQGNGPKIHAENSGPDPLKAAAKELHKLANQPGAITYYIKDQGGRLRLTSANNHSWRMRWKRPSGGETVYLSLTEKHPREQQA